MKPEDEETWRRGLLRFRERKDEFFKTSPESPLPPDDRDSFQGLKYFEPDEIYRFESSLTRYQMPGSLVMGTSKGTRQLFNKVGFFELQAEGLTIRLQAYQSAERQDPSIFLPFRDGTSGKDTYGAARYLDLEVEHDDRYVIDFNYAYNPYCAYSDDYICPLPPQENWLSASIRAGEKKYRE